MDEVEVCWLTGADQSAQAAGVAARALRDGPDWVAISDDPLVRMEMLYGMFADSLGAARVAGVRRGACILGVAAVVGPGRCVGATLPAADRNLGPPSADASDADRLRYFRSVLAAHDPDEPHWHVGPVGVAPGFQSQGTGRAALTLPCDEFDDHGRTGWVKTTSLANVRFYGGCGFEVVEDVPMLAAHFWFLRRQPR